MAYVIIMEAKLQSKIIKWLKERGAYVIKTKPGPGTPTGCLDIVFFYRQRYGTIEVKASETARYQPGQEATLELFKSWTPFAYKVYPENWPLIQKELLLLFF